MKKHGFTLAEVLVTLGIIGVVSDLVMTSLTASVKSKKIGPTLSRAKAAFEQGTQRMLFSYESNSLSNTKDPNEELYLNDNTTFLEGLKHNLKGGVRYDVVRKSDSQKFDVFTSSDGIAYVFSKAPFGNNTDLDHPHEMN